MTKYPVTRRDDVLPGPLPDTSHRKFPEGWDANPNTSVNKPNDPQKRYRPTSFNTSDDYQPEADHEDEG